MYVFRYTEEEYRRERHPKKKPRKMEEISACHLLEKYFSYDVGKQWKDNFDASWKLVSQEPGLDFLRSDSSRKSMETIFSSVEKDWKEGKLNGYGGLLTNYAEMELHDRLYPLVTSLLPSSKESQTGMSGMYGVMRKMKDEEEGEEDEHDTDNVERDKTDEDDGSDESGGKREKTKMAKFRLSKMVEEMEREREIEANVLWRDKKNVKEIRMPLSQIKSRREHEEIEAVDSKGKKRKIVLSVVDYRDDRCTVDEFKEMISDKSDGYNIKIKTKTKTENRRNRSESTRDTRSCGDVELDVHVTIDGKEIGTFTVAHNDMDVSERGLSTVEFHEHERTTNLIIIPGSDTLFAFQGSGMYMDDKGVERGFTIRYTTSDVSKMEREEQEKIGMIVCGSSGCDLYSTKTHKRLGHGPTRASMEKREKVVNMFKHMRKNKKGSVYSNGRRKR